MLPPFPQGKVPASVSREMVVLFRSAGKGYVASGGTPKVRSRIVLRSVGAKLGHPLRYSAGFVQTFRLLRAGDYSSFAGPAKCCFVNPFYAKFVQTL